MIEYYTDKFGTSFGFEFSNAEQGRIMHGVVTDAHSYRDFGLLPRFKPVIEPPEVQTSSYEVPGRDGTVDTTEALDGLVHYFNRKGTFDYVVVGDRKQWDVTYSRLKNRLHGKRKKILIDEEKDGYYYGRLTVEAPAYDSKAGEAFFTITADLEPFKYELTTTIEPWMWDPFSFENGVIRDYSAININNGGTVTLYGSAIPTVPDVRLLSGALSVTYPGHSTPIPLDMGSNLDKMTDLILTDAQEIPLTFSGTGTVQIFYRMGWL